MGDMLSQAEIDALLSKEPLDEESEGEGLLLQDAEMFKYVEYEGMLAAQTTLSTILGQNTKIAIDNIEVTTWEQLGKDYDSSQAVTAFSFKGKVKGTNLLLMAADNAKRIISSMTGEGTTDDKAPLSEFDLGVLGEIMNQAAGSFVTATSALINDNISITPPDVSEYVLSTSNDVYDRSDSIVKIVCTLDIESISTDYILHIMPLSMASEIAELKQAVDNREIYDSKEREVVMGKAKKSSMDGKKANNDTAQYKFSESSIEKGAHSGNMHVVDNVNVQPAQFQLFDDSISQAIEKKNLNLIMDVPLQITVELGRTHKLIRNILEYGPGSVIELDKLAGDPVDILVNGKSIAKGEVVVIDESFGVRVTDIVDASKRL